MVFNARIIAIDSSTGPVRDPTYLFNFLSEFGSRNLGDAYSAGQRRVPPSQVMWEVDNIERGSKSNCQSLPCSCVSQYCHRIVKSSLWPSKFRAQL